MSSAYVTEYKRLSADSKGNVIPAPDADESKSRTVTFSTTAQSVEFDKSTRFIRVVAKTACHYEVGINPVATTTSAYLPAGVYEYLGVDGTKNLKIAFVDA